MRHLNTSYFFNEEELFFSSKAPDLVFSATYLRGSLAPSALPTNGGPAVSPIDKSRKDSVLPPVTSEKLTLVLRVKKLAVFQRVQDGEVTITLITINGILALYFHNFTISKIFKCITGHFSGFFIWNGHQSC